MALVDEPTIKLDVITLLSHASWPVRATTGILIAASCLVWMIAALKFLQLARLRASSTAFERLAREATTGRALVELAAQDRHSPGARIVRELEARRTTSLERLRAAADRAIVTERQRAQVLLSSLASVASAAPFVGLFGTVYGIMDAFVRIGAAKSAALPVVAPAIGEALVATAIGLAAAIPAVVFYNFIDKRVGDFTSELEASASEWVSLLAESNEAFPLFASPRKGR
ncbi:MAG: MotA/TolQ/ExbB proton channel family protein [Myxococcales bacterium]|jgi:biopolymer transport protein TolQ